MGLEDSRKRISIRYPSLLKLWIILLESFKKSFSSSASVACPGPIPSLADGGLDGFGI